jgi:hypothetical protein
VVIYWGLRDLSFPRFLSFTLTGILPWTLLLAAIGFQLSGHIDQFDDWLKEAKNIIFGAVLTVVALLYLRHRLNRKNPASFEAPPPPTQSAPQSPETSAPSTVTLLAESPEAAHSSGRPS